MLEPNVYNNCLCVHICWFHYFVRVGMFDFLEVTFRSETVEHAVCAVGEHFAATDTWMSVGLYRVCDVSCRLHLTEICRGYHICVARSF